MASTSAAAVSSSPTATLSLKKHDVFISFRGEDTRRNFTSHLYAALCGKKIETYIDDRLVKGNVVWPELVKAIHDSSIFLVILSENYASSRWCLNELIEIMECKKKGHVVFPVFYNINPSDVRKQTGSYQTAFDKHMSKQSDDTVQKWKAALSEVADVAGFHSSNYSNESDLVKEVIKGVLQQLNYKYPIEVGDIIKDQNYEKIESSLQIESKEVQIIGIWGMGGIGKTTIANAIFYKVSSRYEGSCFLENTREETEKHGLNSLRSKLRRQLLGEDYLHFDAHRAESILKRKKVLVVLDDVNNSMLLEKLVGKHDRLGAGSTVIVTTRDKQVLLSIGVDKIYEVKKMNYQNSLQLFSRNAFAKGHPQEGFEKLSEKAVVYADGIPLALKVLGSFLRSKNENEWDSALEKLKKIPKPEIHDVLKLSYEELDDSEKNIFLDIAFFFKGDRKERVINILNACGFYAVIGIRNLLNKALITIDLFDCIEMHDLIQEMGWKIVREESINNPRRRSRLRDSKEVCEVLKNNKGIIAVEGILLDMTQITDLYVSPEAFKNMPNIRILIFKGYKDGEIINSVYLPADLELLSDTLRYFQWDGYPLKSLSSTFCPDNLVEISMPASNVEKLWDGVQKIPNLERIELDGCQRLLEIPDLSGAPNLKSVSLRNCESLRHLHLSISSLNKLEKLEVAECEALKSLCSNACLPSLRLLDAEYCSNLEEFSVTLGDNHSSTTLYLAPSALNEVPSSILNLRNLETFSFPICESLKNLPENFADCIVLSDAKHELDISILRSDPKKHERDTLIALRKVLPSPAFRSVRSLYFDECYNLDELPDNIWLLSSLEKLTLRECHCISLPESIKDLPRLTHLDDVSLCRWLRSVPGLPQSIVRFDASYCKSLKTVLSSMSGPPKKHKATFVFRECIELGQDAHNNILKDAIVRIELAAKRLSAVVSEDKRDTYTDDDNVPDYSDEVKTGQIFYFLPTGSGNFRNWFHYCSTQPLLTVELPPNSKFLGFVLYVVLSQALLRALGSSTRLKCECYMETNSGERFELSRFPLLVNFEFANGGLGTKSDHVLLWYDAKRCKQIMEDNGKTEAINKGHATSNPKLTFRFFAYGWRDHKEIEACGLRWIEQGGGPKFKRSREVYELAGSAVQNEVEGSESEEEEEAVPPTKKFKQCVIGNYSKQVEDLSLSFQERLHIS